MAVLGPHDLKDLVLPTLWDQTYLNNVRLQGNRTFPELMAEVQGGLNAFNQGDLLNQPHYSGLLAVQDTPEVEYATGSTAGVQEFVDYNVADPYRGITTGHMLPRKVWNRVMGWTLLYLQRARQEQIDADLRSTFTDIRNHFQRRALQQFFRSTAVTVGASGKSVPFADGGTADSTYVPYTSPRGASFTSSHNHYLRQATPVTDALFTAAVAHLWEHGHDAPYEAIIPQADIATWVALSGFRPPAWPELMYMSNTTVRSNLDNIIGDIVGYYESSYGLVRLWATPRLPTGYYGVYKSYGALDARNPLRMYVNPAIGAGWNVAPGQYINAPQFLAVLMAEYDFGVGMDRTNGVAVYSFASGNYVDPTIS
jgi:hypothetical protein